MAKVLSSISGNLISAASAGYAPTNSADVSAIASGYQVVSSTATQLYAGTAYVTSVNGDALSASRAGNAANASLATSAYYDGTGRLISALPDAAEVSSIASSYAESAASGKADSSSLSSYALSSDVSGVIDTVSTNSASWSGGSLPISGSAGDDTVTYDASSIRFTRYDTAGEPDIRTAILSPDSIWMDYTLDGNDHTSMTLNESMLNFTLPDGDRYVDAYTIDAWNSAVDTVSSNSASWGGIDSATVSAIASGYAESAASSKLDTTAQVVSSTSYDTYQTGWFPERVVNKINGSGIFALSSTSALSATYARTATRDSTGRLLSSLPDSAAVSAIASSYAESAVSGKADSSSLSSYALSSDVSGVIDTVSANSATWGGGATGDYVDNSALDSATVRSSTGSTLPQVTGISSISGKPLIPKLLPQPTMQYGGQSTFAYMPDTSIWTTADAATGVFSPLQYATGACLAMDSNNFKAYYKGNEWFVSNTATDGGMLRGEIHATRGIRVVGSAKNSASGFQLHPSGVNGVSSTKTWELKPECVSGVGGNGTAWKYGTAENIMLTSVHDTVSANSASWGQGGVDSATVSSIASSYAESAVSSKADSSSLSSYALSSDVSGVIDTVSSNSATWGGGGVVTATGSASVLEGFFPRTLVSSINGSALLPYGYSSLSGNSANWNNTRTAVTANSANWNSAYSLISGVTALMDAI